MKRDSCRGDIYKFVTKSLHAPPLLPDPNGAEWFLHGLFFAIFDGTRDFARSFVGSLRAWHSKLFTPFPAPNASFRPPPAPVACSPCPLPLLSPPTSTVPPALHKPAVHAHDPPLPLSFPTVPYQPTYLPSPPQLSNYLGKNSPDGTSTLLDATPDYLQNPIAAANVHAIAPHTKLVVLVRNPIDRAYAAWKQANMHGQIR
eukprot:3280322-Pleurochrysis_carterae.AAC.1